MSLCNTFFKVKGKVIFLLDLNFVGYVIKSCEPQKGFQMILTNVTSTLNFHVPVQPLELFFFGW